MGTRRSKHNKGRKPLYKEHRLVASNILARPLYGDGGYYSTRTWWNEIDKFKLEVLCEADAEIEPSANALGRTPTSIAHRARDFGITLPREWARIIAPKRKIQLRKGPEPLLAYPYIAKQRPEYADLLAINEIIPKAIPENMRADMCQEIMVAILEGRTSLDILRSRSKSASYFIRKFYNENFEQGGSALTFSAMEDEDWNSDRVASSLAAKDWHREQFLDRAGYTDALRTYTPPDQFEAAWRDQVGRLHLTAHQLGHFLSAEDIEELMEDGSA